MFKVQGNEVNHNKKTLVINHINYITHVQLASLITATIYELLIRTHFSSAHTIDLLVSNY